MLIAKDRKAETVLSMLTAMENIPANKIFNALQTSDKLWAATHTVELEELINKIRGQGINPVVTGILVSGNTSIGMTMENIQQSKLSALLKIGNLAVFKGDKLIGWLTEEESIGFNAITNNIKTSVSTLSFPDGGRLTIDVTKVESKIKPKIIDGKPKIEVQIQAEGNIGEVQCEIDLSDPESIPKVESLWNKLSEERTKKVIKTAQEDFKSDIFGFGEAFHRHNPKEWKKLKKNWNEDFTTLPVEIKINNKIRRIGTVINSVSSKKE